MVPLNKRVKIAEFPAKKCEKEDFGTDTTNLEVWERFKNKIIICPDLSKTDAIL